MARHVGSNFRMLANFRQYKRILRKKPTCWLVELRKSGKRGLAKQIRPAGARQPQLWADLVELIISNTTLRKYYYWVLLVITLYLFIFSSASLLPVAAAAICQRYNGASEESTVLLPVAAAANLPAL